MIPLYLDDELGIIELSMPIEMNTSNNLKNITIIVHVSINNTIDVSFKKI